MKKDFDLARRIRGEKFKDQRETHPKIGKESFYMLPYVTDMSKMDQLSKVIVGSTGSTNSKSVA